MGRSRLLIGIAVVTTIAWLAWPRDDESPRGPAPEVSKTTTTVTPHDPRATMRGRFATLPPVKRGALRLEGQVIDADKQPVAGARVVLGGGEATLSEDDGSFVFDGLAGGEYALAAEAGNAYTEESEVALDETSDPVTLELRRGATLAVHVIASESGAPLAGATVKTRDRANITDASGTAVLRSIDDGSERVEVTAPGRAPVSLTVKSDDPEATVERVVELATGAKVSGVVLGPDGRAVPEASVYITASGGERHWVSAGADGTWTTDDNLPAGKHSITASSSKYTEVPEVLFETDGSPRTGVVVHVAVAATIRGIVVDLAGKPVAGARVTGGGSGTSDEQGRFVIEGVAGGEYAVSAWLEQGATEDVNVTVARGDTVDVRLVMRPSGLAGVVVDERGQPVADASVRAHSPTADRTRYASTDDYGKFSFAGIEPGEYLLRASHDNAQHRDDEPGAVTVKTGTFDARLVVAPLATITARVVQDGKPVPMFGVVVTEDETSSFADPTVVRTPDGRFTRSNLGPGRWHVILVGPSFTKKLVAKIDVPRGGSLDLGDIVVERGRTIAGRVTDASGAPIQGAIVGATTSSSDHPIDVTLRDTFRGDVYTRTDAAGRFTLVGLQEDSKWLAASHPKAGRTQSIELTAEQTTVELVLRRTGMIAGTVRNYTPKQRRVWASRVSDDELIESADLDPAGNFKFTDLPAGDYVIELRGVNTLRPQPVTVTSGGVAHVELVLPEHPITLTIRSATCEHHVSLDAPDGTNLSVETCKDGTGDIEGVVAGSYQACVDSRCIPVEIPAQPLRQTITVP